jgi:mersacidin/lichenicidin family type 2 lantibiotic
MTLADKIRAWREPAYRDSLTETERLELSENPAGMIELSGTALDAVAGGWGKRGGKRGHGKGSHGKGGSSRSGKGSSRSGKGSSRSGKGSGSGGGHKGCGSS